MKKIFLSVIRQKVFKAFTAYTLLNFINQAIPFILLPILTRIIDPAEYGILGTFMALLAVINVIVSMGSSDAAVRRYYDRSKKAFNYPKFVFNGILLNFMVLFFFIAVIFLSKNFLSAKTGIPRQWLFVLPVIGGLTAVYSTPIKLLIFKNKPLEYSKVKISQTIVEVGASLFFVVVMGLSWRGRVLGVFTESVVFFCLSMFMLFRSRLLEFKVDFKYILNILMYGAPVVIHSLGYALVSTIDKIFLNNMVGLSSTGVYSAGCSIAGVLGFFTGALSLAWTPFLYERLSDHSKDMRIKLVKATYLVFLFVFAMGVLLIIASPIFVRVILGGRFYGALPFIPWLALGLVFHGMYVMVVSYVFYSKRTYALAFGAVVIVAVDAATNYFFIKANGAIGAAQATFFTFMFRFFLIWYLSNRVFPMPWFYFLKRAKHDA